MIGLPELERNLQKLAHEVDSLEFENGLLGVARVLRDELKAASPVGPEGRISKKKVFLAGMTVGVEGVEKSGNLKSSWRAKRFKVIRRGTPAVFVAGDRKIGPHAQLVEFGHGAGPAGSPGGAAPPHPFVRPALDKFKGEYQRLVATMLREKFGKFDIDTAGSL
jgi:HK97 gp10 family phage protein